MVWGQKNSHSYPTPPFLLLCFFLFLIFLSITNTTATTPPQTTNYCSYPQSMSGKWQQRCESFIFTLKFTYGAKYWTEVNAWKLYCWDFEDKVSVPFLVASLEAGWRQPHIVLREMIRIMTILVPEKILRNPKKIMNPETNSDNPKNYQRNSGGMLRQKKTKNALKT